MTLCESIRYVGDSDGGHPVDLPAIGRAPTPQPGRCGPFSEAKGVCQAPTDWVRLAQPTARCETKRAAEASSVR